MRTSRIATCRLGNYGECELTATQEPDGRISIAARVVCPYGNEWPFAIDGSYSAAPFAPALKQLLAELGVDVDARPGT